MKVPDTDAHSTISARGKLLVAKVICSGPRILNEYRKNLSEQSFVDHDPFKLKQHEANLPEFGTDSQIEGNEAINPFLHGIPADEPEDSDNNINQEIVVKRTETGNKKCLRCGRTRYRKCHCERHKQENAKNNNLQDIRPAKIKCPKQKLDMTHATVNRKINVDLNNQVNRCLKRVHNESSNKVNIIKKIVTKTNCQTNLSDTVTIITDKVPILEMPMTEKVTSKKDGSRQASDNAVAVSVNVSTKLHCSSDNLKNWDSQSDSLQEYNCEVDSQ